MKNLNKIIEDINALKAEDYINQSPEIGIDNIPLSEYERGFDSAVGLCLSILDNEQFIHESKNETKEPIEKSMNFIVKIGYENIRKALYNVYDKLFTDEQIDDLIGSKEVIAEGTIFEGIAGKDFMLGLSMLAVGMMLQQKETPKKSKFEERIEIQHQKEKDRLNKNL